MAAKRADLVFHRWVDSFEETESQRQKHTKKHIMRWCIKRLQGTESSCLNRLWCFLNKENNLAAKFVCFHQLAKHILKATKTEKDLTQHSLDEQMNLAQSAYRIIEDKLYQDK